MLQIKLPFDPPKATMKHLPYRERLLRLLEGELDFHGQKSSTPFHAWHSFPAKFPPQLPKVFIKELTEPGETVFDPMMGSCTTLIEAVVRGRKALGTDIDPLSILIARAKMNGADISRALTLGGEVIKNAKDKLSTKPSVIKKALKNRFDSKSKDFVDYWFAPETQLELMALIMEIESTKDGMIRDFFTLIFSAIIITKSGGVSLARDLAHTRPHRVSDKKPSSPFVEFQKKMRLNLKKMDFIPMGESHIIKANAQHLPLDANSVDLIVTSPPYASNAIDYMRAHKFSLVWLGHPINELGTLRKKYIGGETITGADMIPLPKHSQNVVQRLSEIDPKKGKVLHRYYSEMTRSLSEMSRILKPGCAAVLVVGTSYLRGMNIEIHTCLEEIGVNNGLEHIHTGVRKLDRNKRMMPARWNKNKKEGIEARMHEEYVIGFIKTKA